MASLIHLDTHAFIWLHDGDLHRFHSSALAMLRSASLEVSPMVVLELQYLHEIGRLKPLPDQMLAHLQAAVRLRVCSIDFASVARAAVSLTWTRDAFDRLICATARAAGASLLTKDANIRANEPSAFWDQPPP